MIEILQKSEHQLMFEAVASESSRSIYSEIFANVSEANEKQVRMKEILKFDDEKVVFYDSFVNYNQNLQDTFLIEIEEKIINFKAVHTSKLLRAGDQSVNFGKYKIHKTESSVKRSNLIDVDDLIVNFKNGSAMSVIQSYQRIFD